MTLRLYRENPLQTEFEARVVAVEELDASWGVILDRTAFYPEGGGQPADHGTLDGVHVTHVREDGDRIIHITGTPLTKGSNVHGVVDKRRRRDYMQQHTGQHVISAAFWKESGMVTISVHMGAEDTTIDLEAADLTADQLEAVRQRVDEVIAADLPMDAVEAAPEELDRFTLRKPPPVDGPVRLVRIGDFDCVGCCGLHLPATGAVRLAVCTGWEHIRGNVRTHWLIGDRAVAGLWRRVELVSRLRDHLATRDEDLPNAVRRLQAENTDMRGRLGDLERRLAEILVRDLLAGAETAAGVATVSRILAEESLEMEKTLVKALLAVEHTAFALVNPLPGRISWTLGIPGDKTLDFRGLKQKHLDPLDARGGGRPPLWQGSAPADTSPADLLSALQQMLVSMVK